MYRTTLKPRVLTQHQKQKILIVIGEMDELMVEILQDLLFDDLGTSENIEVIATSEGDTILEIASRKRVSLFILMTNNILFPSGNLPSQTRFLQVISLIKELKSKYFTPIITASGIDDLIPRALQAGADYSFGRPFPISDFLNSVRKCLNIEGI